MFRCHSFRVRRPQASLADRRPAWHSFLSIEVRMHQARQIDDVRGAGDISRFAAAARGTRALVSAAFPTS